MKPDDEPPDDESIARLLRDAGERERPAAAMQAEVRAAVEAEWRELVAARRSRRRVTGWAVAAGVGAGRARRLAGRPAPRSRAAGRGLAGTRLGSGRAALRRAVALDAARAGQLDRRSERKYERSVTPAPRSRSSPGSRCASTGRRGSPSDRDESASLEEGAAYVDTGAALRAACRCILAAHRFGHRSASGDAIPGARRGRAGASRRPRGPGAHRHVGSGAVSGVAGEQILLDAGRVTRLDLPAHDASWNWAGAVAPAYPIEGSTLLAFLRWAARETGRELVFADPQTEEAASRIVLRGSVEGLTPDESILAVGATTGLAIEVARARIEVRPSRH